MTNTTNITQLREKLEKLDAAAYRHLEGCVHYYPEREDCEPWLEERFDFNEDEPCTCGISQRHDALLRELRVELSTILSALRVAEAEDSVAKFAEYAWLRWEMESSLNNHQETCEVCAARSAWERENFDYLTREDVEEDEHPKTPEVSGCSVFAGLLKDHMWLTEQFKSALKDWQDKTDPHRALQPTQKEQEE